MQVSLNLSPELHQQIETSASSIGKSISDFIIDKVQIGLDEERALKKLEDFIELRLAAADRGEISEKPIEEIVKEAFKKAVESQK